MRKKPLLICAGLSLAVGMGGSAITNLAFSRAKVKEANAVGSITVYVDGLSNYSMTGAPLHLSLDNKTWVDAAWTSGAEYSGIGQFKYVFSADSSSSLYCWFTEYSDPITTYWHPTGGTQWDTNYSSLGSVSLEAGKTYVINVTGYSYGWTNPDGNNTHKWFDFSVSEFTEPECVIKGTVGELDMSSDSTGQVIGSFTNGQIEIDNLHLVTTDNCYFSIPGWDIEEAGYSLISDDDKSLFDSEEEHLVPLENGYYNFYIQKSVIYVTKTAVEDVDDGVYLRYSTDDMATNLVKFDTTVANSTYTLSKYDLTAGVSYKAVKYVDGLMSWCEINAVSCSDANYFNVYASSNNAYVSATGKYTITLTLSGSTWNYAFADTASVWCRDFLDSMTCNQYGASEPVLKAGYTWAKADAENPATNTSYASSFDGLDEIARNAIAGAQADEDGSVIQEAVSRYDTVVANHGYYKFIKNSSDQYRASNVVPVNQMWNASADSTVSVSIIVTVSIVGLAGLVGFTCIRRKKEN